jgi:DNA-binding PadR family transcriptional regulator
MKDRFVKGRSYTTKRKPLKTYEINDLQEKHLGRIVVFGGIKLRDKIIKLLNSN